MKWRAPSERTQFILLSPIIIPVVVMAAPVFFVMVACALAGRWLEKRFGPSAEYAPWFAWRPVQFNDWFTEEEGRWVWLETIERRKDRGHVEYRALITALEKPNG